MPENLVLWEYLTSLGFVVVTTPQFARDQIDLTTGPLDLEEVVRDLELARLYASTLPFVDRARVATVGHSIGGNIALTLAIRDSSVDAVATLDPSFKVQAYRSSAIGWPYFDFTSFHAAHLFTYRPETPLDRLVADSLHYADEYVRKFEGISHSDFTTAALIRSFRRDSAAPNAAREYENVLQLVGSFLLRYVQGRQAAGLFSATVSYREGVKAPTSEGFVELLRRVSVDSTFRIVQHARAQRPNLAILDETRVNSLAYRAINQREPALAVKVFELLTRAYPKSANAWDSLADGFIADGKPQEAVAAYRNVLQVVDSDNTITAAQRTSLKQTAQQQIARLERRP